MKRFLKWTGIALGGSLALGIVATTISYFSQGGEHVVLATTADDPSLPSQTINGYRFHLETLGDANAPVVVALHGGPGNDYRYILPLKPLSKDYRLVFYDQRGSGLSPRVPDEELSVEQYVQDLHDIVEHFSPGRPVRLVGHSWGAMLAAAYIEEHPDKVSHAVLAEPGFLQAEQGNRWMKATSAGVPPMTAEVLSLGWTTLMQALHVDGPDEDASMDFLMGTLSTANVKGAPLAPYYCDQDMSKASFSMWRVGARAGSVIMGSAMNDEGEVVINLVGEGAKSFPREVLFMASRCNTLIGVDVQREHQSMFAKSDLAIIENAGHTMFGEQPAATLAVIRRYLAKDTGLPVADVGAR